MILKVFRKKTIMLIIYILLAITIAIALTPKIIRVSSQDNEQGYIKWVEFNVPYTVLEKTMKLDIDSHDKDIHLDWVEILAYLGAKYGGDFSRYSSGDLSKLTDSLNRGISIDELTENMKYYNYYKDAYSAVLNGFLGEYEIETKNNDTNETELVKKYGLKAFSPIAKGYYYSHFDDFGASRSYGYKRKHLGHDLMGSVGTPVIAIESGIVEYCGWNQYGGWRIGIRSLDTKRYYYYAHLKKDHPYNDIYEGKVVTAGDVIGYLGMTGYSARENVNNINTPHLHFGVQLIFDESQMNSNNEIWIDMYAITKLLEKNKSEVYKDKEANEHYRKYKMYEKFN